MNAVTNGRLATFLAERSNMETRLVKAGMEVLEECKRWPWKPDQVKLLARMLSVFANELESRWNLNQPNLSGTE